MGVTIKDIARYSGTSKSTVSRVLNNSRSVSKVVRDKVLKAVDRMNYRPHAVARSLVLKRSSTCSLIVQDIRNPYYGNAIWYAERLFRERGFSLDIYNADNNAEHERFALESAMSRRVDGALCIGGVRDATGVIEFHSREKLPIVLIDREVQGYSIPLVNLDNVYGARLATNRLFQLGHERVAFATSDFTFAERRRLEGFAEACHEKGLTPEQMPVVSQSEQEWSDGVSRCLVELFNSAQHPTALFCSNDIKALHAIRILRQLGKRVPEDVSVVGYDDINISSTVVPSLTTIHQPLGKMMEIATNLLLDLIEGKPVASEFQIPKPWLIERESTIRYGGDA